MNKKTLLAIIISAVMVLSVFGIIFESGTSSQKLSYNGYKFTQLQKGWQAKINNKIMTFNHHPKELESINISAETSKLLSNTKVALSITYDPGSEMASFFAEEILYLEQLLAKQDIFVQRGLTNATGYSLPEISCANATSSVPVIEFRESSTTSVSTENNCIIVEISRASDLLLIGDRIAYAILGIMS